MQKFPFSNYIEWQEWTPLDFLDSLNLKIFGLPIVVLIFMGIIAIIAML